MKLCKESVIKNKHFEDETLALAFSELVSMAGRSTCVGVSEKKGIDVVFDVCGVSGPCGYKKGLEMFMKEFADK